MAAHQYRITNGLRIFGSSLVLLALFASGAKALTIDVDPGPIGGQANEFSWEVPNPDRFTFDLSFTDGKALSWEAGTHIFRILAPTASGFFFGGLLDAAGEPILGTAFAGEFPNSASPGNSAVTVLDAPVVFDGMRFVSVATEFDPGLIAGGYQIRWVTDAPTVVPEPSTALLFGMGLLGMGVLRIRSTGPPSL